MYKYVSEPPQYELESNPPQYEPETKPPQYEPETKPPELVNYSDFRCRFRKRYPGSHIQDFPKEKVEALERIVLGRFGDKSVGCWLHHIRHLEERRPWCYPRSAFEEIEFNVLNQLIQQRPFQGEHMAFCCSLL